MRISDWSSDVCSSDLLVFADVADAQARLDEWVHSYNHDRPHQSLGMVAPWERFRLAAATPASIVLEGAAPDTTTAQPPATRRVSERGTVSFAKVAYKAGVWLAGETIELVCDEIGRASGRERVCKSV